MKLKEAQTQWVKRAYDIALGKTKDPEFSSAFSSKMLTQTRLNPTHNSPEGVGIAQLDPEEAAQNDVDPMNPEQALDYAATRDSQVYAQTGDMMQALLGNMMQGNPEEAQKLGRSIMENMGAVEEAVSETEEETEDGTFTSMESPEARFKQSVRGNDLESANTVFDQMIDKRVADRATKRA